jgi:myo-inositol-1(or 4)-monophosphatase
VTSDPQSSSDQESPVDPPDAVSTDRLDESELRALREMAERIATTAGEFLLDGLHRDREQVDTKSSGTDMVSEMDRGAEHLIVEAILRERPDDGLLGEEGTERPGSTGLTWVIDPLDGTTNYLYAFPLWSVSIGVTFHGVPVAGAVAAPQLNMLFSAHSNGGATNNGRAISVGSCNDLGLALVATGFGYDAAVRERQGAIVHALLPRVRDLRRGGSAAIDLCFAASGFVDAYFERGLNPWDAAAGTCIAREAGAVVTSLHGAQPDRAMTIAANPYVHGRLREILRDLVASTD